MTPVEARQRARKGEGDQLRDELLDAAERLLVEKGDADKVSVRAIAKAVGVTPPSLYLHFADKDELVFHVCARRYEEFAAVLREAADGHATVADALLAMGRAYVDHALANPEAYEVLFGVKGEVVPDGIEEANLPGMQAFFLLVDTIQRGVDAGEFVTPDPVGAAIAVWSTMHGLVMLLLRGHDEHVPMPEQIVSQVGAQVLQGLLAR